VDGNLGTYSTQTLDDNRRQPLVALRVASACGHTILSLLRLSVGYRLGASTLQASDKITLFIAAPCTRLPGMHGPLGCR
jgi:hypothetical protein